MGRINVTNLVREGGSVTVAHTATYRPVAAWQRTTPYVALGESGPAGSLQVPTAVMVHVEVEDAEHLGSVTYTLELVDGVYRVRHIMADATEGDWLDPEALRRVPYRMLIRRALTEAATLVRHEGDWVSDGHVPFDPLWRVAVTYCLALVCSEHPVAAVAQDFGISRAAAAQRVARARKKGYLRPTTKGVAR